MTANGATSIDADVAHIAETWGPLSDTKLEQAIDALVDKHDPQARQWFTEAARGLNIEFGKPDDTSGTRSMWGHLYSTHAELAGYAFERVRAAVFEFEP